MNSRSAHLMYCDGDIFNILASYEGSNLEDVLRQVVKNPNLGGNNFPCFKLLLNKHSKTIQGDLYFMELFNVIRGEKLWDNYIVDPKYIERLYTKTLTLDDFYNDLTDLNDFPTDLVGYFIVFEDETPWKYISSRSVRIKWVNCHKCKYPSISHISQETVNCSGCSKTYCNYCAEKCSTCKTFFCKDCSDLSFFSCKVCCKSFHIKCKAKAFCFTCEQYSCATCGGFENEHFICKECYLQSRAL